MIRVTCPAFTDRLHVDLYITLARTVKRASELCDFALFHGSYPYFEHGIATSKYRRHQGDLALRMDCFNGSRIRVPVDRLSLVRFLCSHILRPLRSRPCPCNCIKSESFPHSIDVLTERLHISSHNPGANAAAYPLFAP